MKNITELTESEGKEILEYVYGNDVFFRSFQFEPKITPDGGMYITWGGETTVGINYFSGTNLDGYVLHFYHPKVLSWLYKNGYDISEFLPYLENLNEEYERCQNFIIDVLSILEMNTIRNRYNLQDLIEELHRLIDKNKV